MPFRSQAQWRWAFATGQPWARRWARETPGGAGRRFRRLPVNLPDRTATKADGPAQPTTTAQAQPIRGNLYRGEGGRFQRGPGTILVRRPSTAPPRRPGSDRDDRPVPPRGTDAIERFLSDAGMPRTTATALAEYLSGAFADEPEDLAIPAEVARDLIDQGLITLAEGASLDRPNVRIVLTAAGRRLATAIQRGDAERTATVLDQARARAVQTTQRRAERDARRAERDARRAERDARQAERDARQAERARARTQRDAEDRARSGRGAGGGGGGRGGGDPATQEQIRQAERTQRGMVTARRVGLTDEDYQELVSAAEGEVALDRPTLSDLGFVDDQGRITAHGGAALRALERGDVRGYVAARNRAERARDRKARRASARLATAYADDPSRLSVLDRRTLVRHGVARYDAAGNIIVQAPEKMTMEATKAERYGGVPRAELDDSDFVDPDRRAFPIMTRQDVRDAVSSWGRYRGPMSFAEFRRRLIRLAKRKGLADALPASWREDEEDGRKAIDLATRARMVTEAVLGALDDLDSLRPEPDDLDGIALATLARPVLDEYRATPAYTHGEDVPVWVYEDRAVITLRPGVSWAIPYALDGAEVVLATPDDWERVSLTWEPVATPEPAEPSSGPAGGGAVKVAGDGITLVAQAIRFGSPDTPDLSPQRDYFTRETDFWLDHWQVRPMLYHHAQEPATAADPVIGQWLKAWVDDTGVWLEGQLSAAHKYYDAIRALIRRGLLRVSTDSAPHLVVREPRGSAHEVKRWPIIAASLTPTPAEPRLYPVDVVTAMKQCGLLPCDPDEALVQDPGTVDPSDKARSDEAQRLRLELDLLELEMHHAHHR